MNNCKVFVAETLRELHAGVARFMCCSNCAKKCPDGKVCKRLARTFEELCKMYPDE